MHIAPSQIASHLDNQTREIAIRYPDGGLARMVMRREALLLAANEMVAGKANKRGEFQYLIALVSIRGICRVIGKVAKSGRSIAAEDNYTVSRTAGGTFSHNQRAYAYSPEVRG